MKKIVLTITLFSFLSSTIIAQVHDYQVATTKSSSKTAHHKKHKKKRKRIRSNDAGVAGHKINVSTPSNTSSGTTNNAKM